MKIERTRIHFFCVVYNTFIIRICIIMSHSHLNDVEIPETRRFILKGLELDTTLSKPNRSICR